MKTRMFLRPLTLTLAAALALSATAAPAQTQDEINARLGGDAALWTGLFAVALADELRNRCEGLEARTLRATSFVFGLYNRARDYGYSRQQIRAFQTADSTEARMRAEVNAYFAANGVREGDAETYCALGRSEIAAGTQAGELLRAR